MKMPKKLKSYTDFMRLRLYTTVSSLPVDYPESKHLMVYTRAGLIYNRIKKSANRSVLMYNRDVLSYHFNNSTYVSSDKQYEKHDQAVSGKPFLSLALSDLRNLKNYTKFTVVRNPYTRILSAFRQKIVISGARRESRYHGLPGCGDDSAQGFKCFVKFLEDGGLYYNRHWWPQIDLLAMPIEHFDFVLHVEKIASQLPEVYKKAGLSIPNTYDFSSPHELEQAQKCKITGSSTVVELYYDDETMMRVADLYARDFEVFQYSPRAFH